MIAINILDILGKNRNLTLCKPEFRCLIIMRNEQNYLVLLEF